MALPTLSKGGLRDRADGGDFRCLVLHVFLRMIETAESLPAAGANLTGFAKQIQEKVKNQSKRIGSGWR